MIPIGQDKVLSRFARIPGILYPATICEKFHLGIAGSLFCTAGYPLCQDKISHVIASARLNEIEK